MIMMKIMMITVSNRQSDHNQVNDDNDVYIMKTMIVVMMIMMMIWNSYRECQVFEAERSFGLPR